MKLLVLAALVAVALALPVEFTENDLQEWENFKVDFARNYDSEEEHDKRRIIFFENLKIIQAHNARFERDEETFEMGVNQFGDWTAKERNAYSKLKIPSTEKTSVNMFDMPEDANLPKTVDWRDKGAVTPVKDQGTCGACWAFSSTGALEGQNFLKNKKLVSLSEQNLMDCSTAEGNEGCQGGWPDWAYQYIVKNKGIDTEKSYPYQGFNEKCKYKPKGKGATITGSTDIPTGDEKKLQQAVANVGPISVCIDDEHTKFQFYKSGVLNIPKCLNAKANLTHCVLAVGYGTDKKGGDYWLIKNSWNTSWGMKGYAMMSRNKNNQCGIATQAQYPNL